MKKDILNNIFLCLILWGMLSCNRPNVAEKYNGALDAKHFKTEIDGKETALYQIQNKNKMKAAFTNYGGRLVSLVVPGINGEMIDVVVGFKTIDEYVNATEPYFGATIGRYGNRIAKGSFIIDGKSYQGPTNNGVNMLHGGTKGFQYVVWDAKLLDNATLQFSYTSLDGEMGFPGNLKVEVTYQITDDNALKISYQATTDKKTIVNLTNHAFFNLNGEGSGNILGHQLQIFANTYTPVDTTLIPTGQILPVSNTPFDFTALKAIGKNIGDDDQQLRYGKGYDHNFVLNDRGKQKYAARVVGEKSGLIMDIFTDEPGLQFYSGNFMKGNNTFKNGVKDDFRTAFCLETQHFPDSPNQESFPSTLLNVGETYRSVSLYKFSLTK